MTAVWKFPLRPGDVDISMPAFARPLTVQVQHGVPCLWALVDPNLVTERRRFRVVGTGHAIDLDLASGRFPYVGTFQLEGGALVFHVFEDRR